MMATAKSTGAVRIIINHSSPKLRSVSDFFNDSGGDNQALMGGLRELLRAINFAGRGAKIAKCDWNNAYKLLICCLIN